MAPTSPLASPSATLAVLERHGFNTKKALGQNFLVNDAIVRKILDLAAVSARDVVLEIGPGIGTLTSALLSHAGSVVAIERDPALPAVLADTLATWWSQFALIEGDAVSVIDRGLAACGYAGAPPNKVVSNLPYAVAATVVLDVFQRLPAITSATVMVQREVAERMCAKPGTKAYGAYTVKLALYAHAVGTFLVGPANFMPKPHVESTVIRLDRHAAGEESGAVTEDTGAVAEGAGAVAEGAGVTEGGTEVGGAPADSDIESAALIEAASTMADAAFFARRKTIANSCKQFFAGRDQALALAVPAILDQAGIDPRVRGETLTVADYLKLGHALLSLR